MPLAERDDTMEALFFDRPDEPLGIGVEIRTLRRQPDWPTIATCQDLACEAWQRSRSSGTSTARWCRCCSDRPTSGRWPPTACGKQFGSIARTTGVCANGPTFTGAARFRLRTRAAPKIAMTEPTVLPEQAPRLAVATEARFTERFALRYRDRLRYNHRRRLWLIYAPPLWWPDSDGEVYRLALKHVRQ